MMQPWHASGSEPTTGTDPSTSAASSTAAEPAVSLPRGGGAIRGIDEKFTANPVTGTAAVSIPIPVSSGRSGFGPQLALAYDSGAGKTVFGFGWSLSMPAITRKTDKGVPTYAADEDTFLLSGTEDLVPVLDNDGDEPLLPPRMVGAVMYSVRRFRPRTEGLFARIERWTRVSDGDIHWRTISRDNVTSLYGLDGASRIVSPTDGGVDRVFSWLICESRDDVGNVVAYRYKAEDAAAVDLTQAHEQRRPAAARTVNRYIKSIRYGNRVSRLATSDPGPDGWLFEVVFDYGEHDSTDPSPADVGTWQCRRDPFSTYRAGFEIRTYRLCQRVLMFHHFPAEPGVGRNCLVRSLDLTYRPAGDDPTDTRRGAPLASFVAAATHRGYRRSGDTYTVGELPPVEFGYSEPVIDQTVRTLDPDSVTNLPVGVDGTTYRWLDLDGEGIAGVIAEQPGAWFYRPSVGGGRFSAMQVVPTMPGAVGGPHAQFLDLAGDGRLDVVDFTGPSPGFAKRTSDGGWAPPAAFRSLPGIDWADPSLRFVDLDGDGLADLLLTHDDALVWYPSLAEEGFGPARRVPAATDEADGPRLVFAGAAESVYLADMSGDGLVDLVRIRNGDVCYWPSFGHGHFGARVGMDASPLFDRPDMFDQQRLRLADIDGTGTTDLIYLGVGSTRIWFNESGNRWGTPHRIDWPAQVDGVSTVTTADLLGAGTTCLVWSSPLPADVARPMRYIDLLGGRKPHLLTSMINNVGAETLIRYASSTSFSLADKAAGQPWVTTLPFPVHVVEQVTVVDRISRNRFVTSYSYHHGYFDPVEREFRGFGRVDRIDSESLDALGHEGSATPLANADPAVGLPPVLTKTWYHTGCYLGREQLSTFFAGGQDAGEYYREPKWRDDEAGSQLLEDTVLPSGLDVAAEREACRALRGSVLRSEVYALDGSAREPHPYTVLEQNYSVRRIQPAGRNRHGVFLVQPREALTHHYERVPADPRRTHVLTLEVDRFGNVLKEASIGYGRRAPDPTLPTGADRLVQDRPLVTCLESEVTSPVDDADDHRVPVPCEARTYELTGYPQTGDRRFRAADFVASDPADDTRLTSVFDTELDYAEEPTGGRQRRLIEHVRTLFRADDLTGLLPLGTLGRRAHSGESYRLAYTPGLLHSVFRRTRPGLPVEELLPDPAAVLGGGGPDQGGYVDLDGDGRWWAPSGRTYFSPGDADSPAAEAAYAQDHFFHVRRLRDPFGGRRAVTYDGYDLLIVQTRDPVGNLVTAGARNAAGEPDPAVPGIDYRVLRPWQVMDANRNRMQVCFDALGFIAATAVRGRPGENRGDSLDGLDPDAVPGDPLADPHGALLSATTRMVYDLFAYRRTAATPAPAPVSVHALSREVHAADSGGATTPIQHAFGYSDGFGREIQRRNQAEPAAGGAGPRWVSSGWTVYNNKGLPVRQYEPYFSDTHRFEYGVAVGVSPVVFYDPLGRPVVVLHPHDAYSKVVFDAWEQTEYDANDTVAPTPTQTGDPRTDPDIAGFVARYFATRSPTWQTWWARRQGTTLGVREQAAAARTTVHAGTARTAYLDPLGRTFLTLARNRWEVDGVTGTASYATRAETDVEGNQVTVRDAVPEAGDPLGRVVMRYAHDLLGRRMRTSSMEAGERWAIADVAGLPIRGWDSRGHALRTGYDPLRRPTHAYATGADPAQPTRELLTERVGYGEQHPDGEARNLRGRAWLQADQAGAVFTDRYDFTGNLLTSTRRLTTGYRTVPDWAPLDAALPAGAATPFDAPAVAAALDTVLEPTAYTGRTGYDALHRVVSLTAPDGTLVRPTYNAANLIERVDANLRGAVAGGQQVWTAFVTGVDYDAKGRQTMIEYGAGAGPGRAGMVTRHWYDERTFRLSRTLTVRDAADFPADCPDPPPPDSPGCRLRNLHYTYDPVGNLTHVHDEAQQAVFFSNRRTEPGAEFRYDAIYRLIEATGREHLGQIGGTPIPHSRTDMPRVGVPHPGDGRAMGGYSEYYRYDAGGNIEQLRHVGTDPSQPGWRRTFDYTEPSAIGTAASNRLSGSSAPSTPGTPEPFRYDEHGNLVRLPGLGGADPAPNMTWDYRDRLVGVELGGAGTCHYAYDSTGQRIRKVWLKAPGRTEERVYLGGFELFRQSDGTGHVVLERETLHITLGEERVALVETTSDFASADPAPQALIRYQLADHLASASLEVDERARILSYEEYTPYGSTAYQAVRSATETPKRYRYSGRERDEETGLSYHDARYYAPWLGRWTSCDPAGLVDGTNLYMMTSDNPVNLRDVSGMGGKATEKSNVWPQIDQVQPSGSVREFQVKIIDPATGKPLIATIDRGFPAKNEFMSEPMFVEAKGGPGSPRTAGQKIYHPLIEKGVWAEVRSNSAEQLGLKKGDMIFLKTGQNFTIVDESNLAGFKDGASRVYASSPTLARQVNGKWEFQTFSSNEALQEHLAARGSESAQAALAKQAPGGPVETPAPAAGPASSPTPAVNRTPALRSGATEATVPSSAAGEASSSGTMNWTPATSTSTAEPLAPSPGSGARFASAARSFGSEALAVGRFTFGVAGIAVCAVTPSSTQDVAFDIVHPHFGGTAYHNQAAASDKELFYAAAMIGYWLGNRPHPGPYSDFHIH